MGRAHSGVKAPDGSRAPGGTKNTCTSKKLARTCNFSAGGWDGTYHLNFGRKKTKIRGNTQSCLVFAVLARRAIKASSYILYEVLL